MELREALEHLDTMDDSHWTADGAPALEVLFGMVGKKVSRQNVVDAAPKFSRQNTDLGEVTKPAPAIVVETPTIDVSKLVTVDEPMGQREFAIWLNTISKEALPSTETILMQQIEQTEKAEKTAQEMKANLKISLKMTRDRIKAEIPDLTEREANQAYLKSQHDLRSAKVQVTREILKGLKPSDLDPRAMIDRVMARKTQRGTQRPTTIVGK